MAKLKAKLDAYDTPTRVAQVDGEVVLDGPDGIGLSMTPAAAEESAKRLAKGAAEAKRARRKGAGGKA
jgi:hypothetical protein